MYTQIFVFLKRIKDNKLSEENLQTEDKTLKNKLSEILDITTLKDFIDNGQHEYSTAHTKLCFAIISRIYTRLIKGYRFGVIRVSEDKMIVDGNHRYVAYKLAKIGIEIVPATRSSCDQVQTFKEIMIDEEQDWDANHPLTKKYCDEDFLIKENYLKFNDK
jgi:hypothetical protein